MAAAVVLRGRPARRAAGLEGRLLGPLLLSAHLATCPPPSLPTPPHHLPPGLIVFFVSAVFHEVLVGVPMHMVRLWAFWGLMAQIPLMIVSEWLKARFRSDRIGNVVFWVR